MPRPLKEMFKRKGRKSWYMRNRLSGRDQWISLGSDFDEACKKCKALRNRSPETRPERSEGRQLKVCEAVQEWLDNAIRTSRNGKGWRLASTRAKNYINPFLGRKPLRDVHGDDLRQYRIWLEARSISTQTVRHLLSDCRAFLLYCVEREFIDRSPFPRRLLPRVQEKQPKRLTAQEVRAVVSLPDPFGLVARFALATGLRWSEMARARMEDIVGDVLLVEYTKTRRSRRIPLPQALLEELAEDRGKIIPFGEKSSGYYNRKVRQLSGMEDFHVHRLRHTFASVWLEEGGNIAALKEILGHRNVTTTERYARVTDTWVRTEVERLDELRTSNGAKVGATRTR